MFPHGFGVIRFCALPTTAQQPAEISARDLKHLPDRPKQLRNTTAERSLATAAHGDRRCRGGVPACSTRTILKTLVGGAGVS